MIHKLNGCNIEILICDFCKVLIPESKIQIIKNGKIKSKFICFECLNNKFALKKANE
jgi:hypothetical protein